jgi:hypothetical protein
VSRRICLFSSPRRCTAAGIFAGALQQPKAAAPLPGDALVPAAQYCSTRAITIAAPPGHVWPWLVQAGCLRAGFYSNDLLDNLARPNATTIIPADTSAQSRYP